MNMSNQTTPAESHYQERPAERRIDAPMNRLRIIHVSILNAKNATEVNGRTPQAEMARQALGNNLFHSPFNAGPIATETSPMPPTRPVMSSETIDLDEEQTHEPSYIELLNSANSQAKPAAETDRDIKETTY